MYFDTKGKQHTGATVRAAVARARELGIVKIVVASCTGHTAMKVLEAGPGRDIICVTHQVGFVRPGEDEMPAEMRQKLQAAGVAVLTATHLMAGIDRALRFKFHGVYPSEIVAETLRMLGQGVKVCAEICGMAADAGLVTPGQDVVAIAGSAKGADTAVVIKPENSQHFFQTKIREIICKPRDF